MRIAVAEAVGFIISDKLTSASGEEGADQQVDSLLDVLLERFRDNNAFVRSRILQITARLAEARHIPLQYRADFVALSTGRIKDKSSIVRKNALQTVSLLLRTHPFLKDGGKLDLAVVQERVAEADIKLAAFLENASLPSEVRTMTTPRAKRTRSANDDDEADAETTQDESDAEDAPLPQESGNEDAAATVLSPSAASELAMLKVTQRYYQDAVKFSQQMEVCPLFGLRVLG